MLESQEFILPYPPSVNNHTVQGYAIDPKTKQIKINPKTGKRVIKRYNTHEWRAYKSVANFAIKRQQIKPVDGDVKLFIQMYPPDNRVRDTDNILKAVFDSLKKAGIYDDDRRVKEHTVRREDELKGCLVVKLTKWSKDANN